MAKKNSKSKESVQNSRPAISIIMPMYNMEKYVAMSLESLLIQTFQDFEIIVIDDCSTDKSIDVVRDFNEKFGDRLKLIKNKKNLGLPGIVRNAGLKAARGKYITFLDSDDMFTETALEDLYNIAEEKQAEIVHSERYYSLDEEKNQTTPQLATFQRGPYVTAPTLEPENIGERMNLLVNIRTLWWGCNKLILREFLTKNDIKFPVMTSYEDLVFTFLCLCCAKTYVRIPNVFYIYRIRNGSLSHQNRAPLEIITNTIEAIKVMDNFMDKIDFFKQNPLFRHKMLDFYVQGRLEVVMRTYAHQPIQEINEVLRKNVFSVKPQENVALTTYLFNNANISKLTIRHMSIEENRFKKLLSTLLEENKVQEAKDAINNEARRKELYAQFKI